jgi:hypothetical protein
MTEPAFTVRFAPVGSSPKIRPDGNWGDYSALLYPFPELPWRVIFPRTTNPVRLEESTSRDLRNDMQRA